LDDYAREKDLFKAQEIFNRYSKSLNSPLPKTEEKPRKPPVSGTSNTHTPRPKQIYNSPDPPLPLSQINTPTQPINRNIPQQPTPIPILQPSTPVYMAVPPDYYANRKLPLAPVKIPLPDPNRPWYDRIVDYLVGDDPLPEHTICEKCGQDNGAIPKDQIQFTCTRCNYKNEKKIMENIPTDSQLATDSKNEVVDSTETGSKEEEIDESKKLSWQNG